MTRTFAFCLLALLPLSATAAKPTSPSYSELLERDVVGAAAWLSEHRAEDGRGVVVAILDTGVDLTQPGLQRTSEGKPKVVVTRDFSGEGDVKLREARVQHGSDGIRFAQGKRRVRVPKEVVPRILDGRAWIGVFEESRLAGTSSPDADGDGRKDDRFVFVVLRDREAPGQAGWRILVDRNDDGVTDGPGIRPFEVNRDILYLSDDRPGAAGPRLPFTAHIRSDGPTLELHMPSGSHGTHVASIATGFQILGREGFDGIAPGARILSLKIGHNGLSGGATTSDSKRRALEYAARWSRLHDVPVVANISYGIGSETEGRHEIEEAVDEILRRTPKLTVVISAGNDGPGLSTIGTPAGALLAITAAAGYSGRQTGPLLGKERKTRLAPFYFSSRGGELAKPDLLVPGIAFASVPDYDARPIKAGTSMAAPLTTGLATLLWSHAVAQGKQGRLHHGDVKAALLGGCRPLDGVLGADQGAGLPNLGRAVELLDARMRSGTPRPLALRVEVADRRHPSRPGSALYWRLPVAPARNDAMKVTVSAVLPEWWTPARRARWFTRLELRSLPSWVRAKRTRAAIKGEGSADFELFLKGGGRAGPSGVLEDQAVIRGDSGLEARLPLRWVHGLKASGASLFDGDLAPGDVLRRFVTVPFGASAFTVDLEVDPSTRAAAGGLLGRTYLLLHDPEGRRVEPYQHYVEDPSHPRTQFQATGDTLIPGIWEVDLYAHHRNTRALRLDLRSRISRATPLRVTEASRKGDGPVEVAFSLRSEEDRPLWLKAEGAIEGVRRKEELSDDGDRLTQDFEVLAVGRPVRVRVTLSEEMWARVTDVAVRIARPGADEPDISDAMGNRTLELSFEPVRKGKHQVEILFGLTRSDERKVKAEVDLRLPFERDLALRIDGDPVPAPLYPGVPVKLRLVTAGAPPAPGKDGRLYGAVKILDQATGLPWHTVELDLPAR